MQKQTVLNKFYQLKMFKDLETPMLDNPRRLRLFELIKLQTNTIKQWKTSRHGN